MPDHQTTRKASTRWEIGGCDLHQWETSEAIREGWEPFGVVHDAQFGPRLYIKRRVEDKEQEDAVLVVTPAALETTDAPNQAFARGQRDMQHRAAEAITRSSAGKGYSEEQHQLLAEAATAVLSLEVEP